MTPRLNFRPLLGLFLLFVCSSSFSGFAQCDEKKVRKLTTTHLGEYSYETASFRPVSGFGSTKVIDAFFIAYGEEKYRVVNLCHGHDGEMGFEILDANRNVLFSNAKSANGDKFDFIAKASGDYIIRFKYPSDNKSGCVAYAIGYK